MAQHDGDQQRGAANRLYWESDASVAEIAEKLGLSRRALYDAVRPEPAGEACPECRSGMVFHTRTARMLGEVECPECGLEEDIETLREATARAGSALRGAADEREAERREAAAGGDEREAEAAEPTTRERTYDEPAAGGAGVADSSERKATAWAGERTATAGRPGPDERSRRPGLEEDALGPDPRMRERAAWLGGAALAGVVIGAITAWFASRR